MLKRWDELPEYMRTPEVRPYYDILYKKRWHIVLKRIFDFSIALIMLIVLAIPMLIIAIIIKLDSEGSAFYRQERVTTYGKRFKIHKFRTMVSNADKIGSAVTVSNDSRITKVGKVLRYYRIDEFPQLSVNRYISLTIPWSFHYHISHCIYKLLTCIFFTYLFFKDSIYE